MEKEIYRLSEDTSDQQSHTAQPLGFVDCTGPASEYEEAVFQPVVD
jgi:hypothetical protein